MNIFFGSCLPELLEEEVRQIKIHRSNEEGDQIKKGTLNRTTDKQFETNAGSCYVAEGEFASLWASFEIPWSLVTHVDILTIGNIGSEFQLLLS